MQLGHDHRLGEYQKNEEKERQREREGQKMQTIRAESFQEVNGNMEKLLLLVSFSRVMNLDWLQND